MHYRTLLNSSSRTAAPGKRPIRPQRVTFRRFIPLVTLVAVLALWQAATTFRLVSPYVVPAPAAVFNRFSEVAFQTSRIKFWLHVWTTLQEILIGLSLGLAIGFALGYCVARRPWLEDLLSPLVMAFQATPVVAYAPLLVIWFKTGMTSKVVVVVLIVFFPMLMNTIVGIRNVPSDLRDLMRVSNATRWQTFVKLEIPAAMPVLIGGLKLAATLAVIGAVVGEFVSADAGLGFLINDARYRYDTPLVLVAVLTLTLLALSLYNLIALVERRVLAWQTRAHKH
jgi:NitT/TauT family transport system permease protein